MNKKRLLSAFCRLASAAVGFSSASPAEEAAAFFRGLRPGILTSSNGWDWGKKGTPYADIAVRGR